MASCAGDCASVDRDLLVVKAIFFLFYSGTSCIYPYLTVYMQQQGLLASQIGVIKSGGKFISVFIRPALGSIADITGRAKTVAVLTVGVASALLFSVLFIPPVPAREQRHLAEANRSDTGDTQSWFSLTFWLFFWILFVSHGVLWGSVFQVEAATYQIIKKNQRGEFGRQRLFGSVGYALFGFLSGVAMDMYTHQTRPANPGNGTSPHFRGKESDYSVAFYMFLAFMVLSVVCLLALKDWSPARKGQSTGGFLKNLRRLLSQLNLIIVLFAVLLLGACDGASGTFLFLHLKNLGASQTVLGTYLFVKKAAEIPIYVISGWIIKKLGHEVVIGGGFVVYGLRFLLYSFVSNPWWAVAIDTLNSYQAVTTVAITQYASISAGDELQTVAQAIVATTFFSIGDPLGDLVGGQVFDQYGAVVLFRAFAVSCLIGCLLFYLLYVCNGKKEKSTEGDLHPVEENDTNDTLPPSGEDVTKMAALEPGAFLRGGSLSNRAGESIGHISLVRPQDQSE
ncbi:major facilitator superfamily domain-containing protein 6-like [Branchiostoma floridae x Branchiostoma japonicum]